MSKLDTIFEYTYKYLRPFVAPRLRPLVDKAYNYGKEKRPVDNPTEEIKREEEPVNNKPTKVKKLSDS